jgi:HPt (histidine-containing phosphotransfer) domain-containing protein
VPVIAVTAENRLEEHAKLMAEGFDSVIAKPIDRHRLVQQVLSRASTEEENGGIEDEIRRLAPQYLENRRRELDEIRGALDRGDFERLGRIGHRLRGNAKTYGFAELSELGTRLESAAEQRDGSESLKTFEAISAYVSSAEASSNPNSLTLR